VLLSSETLSESACFEGTSEFSGSEDFDESHSFELSSELSESSDFEVSDVLLRSNELPKSACFERTSEFSGSGDLNESSSFESTSDLLSSAHFVKSSDFEMSPVVFHRPSDTFSSFPDLIKSSPFDSSSHFHSEQDPDVGGRLVPGSGGSGTIIGVALSCLFVIALAIIVVYFLSRQPESSSSEDKFDSMIVCSTDETDISYDPDYERDFGNQLYENPLTGGRFQLSDSGSFAETGVDESLFFSTLS
jgi:hypothetical protein